MCAKISSSIKFYCGLYCRLTKFCLKFNLTTLNLIFCAIVVGTFTPISFVFLMKKYENKNLYILCQIPITILLLLCSSNDNNGLSKQHSV